MIIEGEIFDDISTTELNPQSMNINQDGDAIVIDKHQAAQLIEVLQRWPVILILVMSEPKCSKSTACYTTSVAVDTPAM
jgi:hypothetical protein|nr:MAG TPA: hypothetical protein [Caudoviricetes sp.]